jgi:hypothetical protein
MQWRFGKMARGEADDLSTAKRTVEAWARREPYHAVRYVSYAGLEMLTATDRGGTLVLGWKKPR